jgi:valyl-tRNA synthetase
MSGHAAAFRAAGGASKHEDGAMTETNGPGTAGGARDLPRAYQPAEVERALYERWTAADVFAPDGAGSRADWTLPPFVIIQPPPNVTGALHLGHAQRTTVEDALIRHARMQRRPTLWLPGKDHASIAAQFVLDRLLAAEGQTRESLGRDRYLERMWRFVGEVQGIISDQHRRLGASADWRRERFTMDPISARAVRHAFRRLYGDGLAYRTEALINWCPGCRTSVSDLEVIPKPEHGTLWTIRYHLVGQDGAPDLRAWLAVATTRPETLLGDTAVAVHPEDPRYRAFINRTVRIPFVGRDVPVISDDVVDREFGTGAVKITPAHDADDYSTGRRHHLPMITVLDDTARVAGTGTAYDGLDRYEARRRIVADLEAAGDLEATQPHEMLVGHCQRSDDVVEPRLKTQWFVRTGPMAEKALAAVRDGRTRIVPRRFEKTYFDWLENIHDWNVSRQLWWGHRIPAWYCPDGHVTVSELEDGPLECDVCGRPATDLVQELDIFDTWFSSGLWPFSTLGWPERTADLERFYPGSVMETGYDIIFFWVARMMMLGEWLMGETPFRVVYLSGLIRDPYGQKMSKTKGNVIDPLAVVEELGADSLRFAVVNGIAPGADVRLGRTRLEGARNFGNKLWNAARFVLSARPAELPAGVPLELPDPELLGPAEHWILARCADTIDAASAAYGAFQLGEVTRLVYEATWSEYCDWYLELAKARLREDSRAHERAATWQVLAWVLERYLRLLHPVMPFLTEAIWRELPHEAGDPDLLIVADWPDSRRERALVADAAAAEAPVVEMIDLMRTIRNARVEAGIEPAAWIQAIVHFDAPSTRGAFASLAGAFAPMVRARLHQLETRDELEAAGAGWLVAISGPNEARLHRSDADVERERGKLRRELDQARLLLAAAEGRLANPDFVARAPEAIVEGARRRALELSEQVALLVRRLEE